MKIYSTQAEINADLDEKGNLYIQDDVDIRCSCAIAGNITAENITAWDIRAKNITAGNVTAGDITVWDITVWGITAWNITAGDITAKHITAGDISYYAVCIAYQTFTCHAVKGRRKKSLHACLDREIVFKKGDNYARRQS